MANDLGSISCVTLADDASVNAVHRRSHRNLWLMSVYHRHYYRPMHQSNAAAVDSDANADVDAAAVTIDFDVSTASIDVAAFGIWIFFLMDKLIKINESKFDCFNKVI